MRTAEKKIKKLKRSRLWPSIFLFLLSLLASSLLLAAELSIYASYVVESKFAQARVDTVNMAQSIDTRMELGEDLETAFTQMVKTIGQDRQAVILDAEENVLASHGDVSMDVTQKITLDLSEEQELYLDQDPSAQFNQIELGKWKKNFGREMDSFDMAVSMIVSHIKAKGKVFERVDAGSLQDTILELSYWQPAALADGASRLITKNILKIQRDDLLYGVGITAISGVMFLLIFSVQFMNVVRQFRSRRRIEKLLTIDNVTGGPNWIAFAQKASRLLARYRNTRRCFAVVQLSMIKYQSYCSLYGAKAGDLMLTQVDRILADQLGRKEVFGHVNGPDFALLLNVPSGENGKQKTMDRVEQLLNGKTQKNIIEGVDRSMLVFQAGIYFVDPGQKTGVEQGYSPVDISDLYVDAGIAKASIASEEGIRVACFSQKMLEDQLWQHRVENTMQIALENEEFQVYIQPKYDPNSNSLLGGEALVRWVSPTDGMIAPGKFIPIFEKTGFITKLDDYMISHVAKLQSVWLSQGKKIVPISVNVSRAHFAQPDLAEHICDLVDVYRVPHKCIEIELTESAFFDDKKALLTTVRKLQKYGFEVSMDDFGSGYSSLNSLKDLPLDVLKLDADFFRGDDFNTRGEIVVGKAIALAKQLNMKIVAEGVEKKEQVDFLASQGCDMIQGYYFAKPMPAAEYADRLK